jgi:hypothetical protein
MGADILKRAAEDVMRLACVKGYRVRKEERQSMD